MGTKTFFGYKSYNYITILFSAPAIVHKITLSQNWESHKMLSIKKGIPQDLSTKMSILAQSELCTYLKYTFISGKNIIV